MLCMMVDLVAAELDRLRERIAGGARVPRLSGVARRTLSKAPYSPAQIGYLACADAQPTMERRMRAAGLICLGAGAGLTRGDLRDVRGTDVACRSGGVVVQVRAGVPG
jgi:hypothetical protein